MCVHLRPDVLQLDHETEHLVAVVVDLIPDGFNISVYRTARLGDEVLLSCFNLVDIAKDGSPLVHL